METAFLERYASSLRRTFLTEEQVLAHCSAVGTKHAFYINLPHYLNAVFEAAPAELTRISRIAYLLFRGLLHLDKIIDDGQVVRLPLFLAHHEQAMREICCDMRPDERFWTRMNAVTRRFFKGVELERRLSAPAAEVAYADYSELSVSKSCHVFIVPALLEQAAAASAPDDAFDICVAALSEFHVGLQLLDDFADFSDDLHCGRHNWLVHLQNTKMKDAGAKRLPPAQRFRLALAGGLGDELLETAGRHFRKAGATAIRSGLDLFDAQCRERIAKVEALREQIARAVTTATGMAG